MKTGDWAIVIGGTHPVWAAPNYQDHIGKKGLITDDYNGNSCYQVKVGDWESVLMYESELREISALELLAEVAE